MILLGPHKGKLLPFPERATANLVIGPSVITLRDNRRIPGVDVPLDVTHFSLALQYNVYIKQQASKRMHWLL